MTQTIMARVTRLFGSLPRRNRRASMMVEFAIVGPVFFLMLFFIFEVAYDQFLQEVLEGALAVTARQMQIGTSLLQSDGVDLSTPDTFTSQYFCPNAFGFLNCNNLYVRVEILDTSFSGACSDVYQSTTGKLPVSSGNLSLLSFTSQNGFGTGTTAIASTPCDINSTGQGYCSPGQKEMVLLSAVYVAPTFLGGLMPAGLNYKYGGNYVRAQLASTAFETETYTAPSGTAPKGTNGAGYTGC